MLKRFLAMAMIAVGGTVMAQTAPVMSLDILDVESGGPTPAGTVVIDGLVDADNNPGGAWTASGIRCILSNGAAMIYRDGDANAPGVQPQLINTGAANDRNVSMLSRPNGRNLAVRFNNGQATIAGRYSPTGPDATTDPTEMNIAYFAATIPTPTDPGVDGAVLRIAIDTHGVPGYTDAATYVLLGAPDPTAGTLVASIVGAETGVRGFVGAANNFPTPTGVDGFLYLVPEPTSLVLLALGALAFRRR